MSKAKSRHRSIWNNLFHLEYFLFFIEGSTNLREYMKFRKVLLKKLYVWIFRFQLNFGKPVFARMTVIEIYIKYICNHETIFPHSYNENVFVVIHAFEHDTNEPKSVQQAKQGV